LDYFAPTLDGIYPGTTTNVTFTFSVKNNGPEQAGDITVNFTPPKGTSFNAIDFAATGFSASCVNFPATGNYINNSYYKCTHYSSVLPTILGVGQSISGSIVYNILPGRPNDIQFRFSCSCSSIEKIWANNFQTQMIYLDYSRLGQA